MTSHMAPHNDRYVHVANNGYILFNYEKRHTTHKNEVSLRRQ